MHEVRKVHLGRQAFTIAADAYKELQDYLHAIQEQVDDAEIVHEIESRMAELLTEHGITGDKVVLAADIAYLQEQLGKPEDFLEDAEQPKTKTRRSSPAKRLYRDTDNAMVAGVAAGLAQYFGIDVLIFRILFVAAAFAGGWGIVLYLILWLLVPEARTASERLQMAGKPVTVNSLKEVVARADVAGAAKRANTVVAGTLNTAVSIVLKALGIGLVLCGLCILLALFTAGGYLLIHTGNLFGQDIFPFGWEAHLLIYAAGTVAALLALFTIIFGIAAFKRKWPVSSWVVGGLVGLLLLSIAGSIALGADIAPQVRDRYNAHLHATTRTMQPFTAVTAMGEGVNINFEQSSTYAVRLNYYDNPNLQDIKTTVKDGTLTIDSTSFDWHRHCPELCIPDTYDVTVTVQAPNADTLTTPLPPLPFEQQ